MMQTHLADGIDESVLAGALRVLCSLVLNVLYTQGHISNWLKKKQLKLLLKTSFAPVNNMYVFYLLAEK